LNKILFVPIFTIALLVLVGNEDAFAYSGPISNNAECISAGGSFSGSTCTIGAPAKLIPAGSTWDVKPGITLKITTLVNVVGNLNVESGAFLVIDGSASASSVGLIGTSFQGILTNFGEVTVIGGNTNTGVITVGNAAQLINKNKMTFRGGIASTSGSLQPQAGGRVTNDCSAVMTFIGNRMNSGVLSNAGAVTNKGHMEFNGGSEGGSGSLINNLGTVSNENPGGVDILVAVNPTAGIDFNPSGPLNAGTLIGNTIIDNTLANTCPVNNIDDEQIIGGEIIPLDTTALLLAGAQSSSWMIPVVLSVLGIGLFVVSRKTENS
jgi:hypothetical protein